MKPYLRSVQSHRKCVNEVFNHLLMEEEDYRGVWGKEPYQKAAAASSRVSGCHDTGLGCSGTGEPLSVPASVSSAGCSCTGWVWTPRGPSGRWTETFLGPWWRQPVLSNTWCLLHHVPHLQKAVDLLGFESTCLRLQQL